MRRRRRREMRRLPCWEDFHPSLCLRILSPVRLPRGRLSLVEAQSCVCPPLISEMMWDGAGVKWDGHAQLWGAEFQKRRRDYHFDA